MLKFWQRKQPRKAKTQNELDCEALSRGDCPNCTAHDSFYAGPCGGAGQDILCGVCREEFMVVGTMFVQRLGPAGQRAQTIYGLEPVAQA